MKKYQGYSLIELLVVIVLIAMILAISSPILISSMNRNEISSASSSFSSSLRVAQMNSMARKGSGQWGVRVDAGKITVFKGSSYATRDQNYDYTTEIPSRIAISGVNEIVFTDIYGDIQTPGSTTFSSGGYSKTVSFNTKNGLTK